MAALAAAFITAPVPLTPLLLDIVANHSQRTSKSVIRSLYFPVKLLTYPLKFPSYFASEADFVKQIRDATGANDARRPICLLVEAADYIVYLAVDVEDTVKKSVLSWRELLEQLDVTAADSVRTALAFQDQILKAGRSKVPPELDDIKASAFQTAAISVMAEGAFNVFKGRYTEIMHGQYPGELLQESDSYAFISPLKRARMMRPSSVSNAARAARSIAVRMSCAGTNARRPRCRTASRLWLERVAPLEP